MSRIPLLLSLAVVLTAGAVAVGTARGGPASTAAPARTRSPLIEPVEITAAVAPAEPPPVAILRHWDARRAEAWARGDPALLRPLYTRGSQAGRRDRTMLGEWAARGLVVRRLGPQLLSVRTLAHTRSTWTLLVTDRLSGGVAVGAGVCRRLPRDQATTRTLRLRHVGGAWRVAWVRPGEVSG